MSINKRTTAVQLSVLCSLLFAFSNLMAHQVDSCNHSYEHKQFHSALQQCTLEIKQNPAANFILGQMYEHGSGVTKNKDRAISYYSAAVLKNNVDAQIALGKLQTENGKYIQSYAYFSLAVDNGSLQALHLKNSIENDLSNQELAMSGEFLNIVKRAIIEERKPIAIN